MAKSNPLFVDSTKFHGDSIGTQIELSKIALYEGEELAVLITNHLGEVRQIKMSINEDCNYQSKVWLSHQKTFTYQFVIHIEEKRILQSAEKKARAQYAIVDQWQPVLPEENAPPMPDADPVIAPGTPINIPEHIKSVASLIDKFGL